MSTTLAPYSVCNYTIDQESCTPQTCCLDQGSVTYLPTIAGNTLYLSFFAVMMLAQIGLGFWYRTWGFMIGVVSCCLLEIIGYVGRVMMNQNIFAQNPFIIYLTCLTIAPAFLTASIYLCLSRLITLHGPTYARFAPKTYTYVFILFDLVALVLQAAGGAIAAGSSSPSSNDMGVNIMIAGLAWQVASLIIFMVLCADFAYRVYTRDHHERQQEIYRGVRLLMYFESALTLAVFLILIRSSYRVAELQAGFNSSLANNQTIFMILEGPMLIISVLVLTIFHPGFVFGRSWGGLEATKDGFQMKNVSSTSFEMMQPQQLQK